jgi:alanine racemase
MPYHLKIDTGMGRLGVQPGDAVRFLGEAKELKGVQLAGVMTHLSSAEDDDQSFTDLQAVRFRNALAQIEAAGFTVPFRHAANSAAALFRPDIRFDMVRAGLILYGIPSSPKGVGIDATPVMSFKTRISLLKRVPTGTPISYGRSFVAKTESLIATLPVGYADGLQRRLSNKGRVIVRGGLAPIAGNVTMDSTLIDVTHVPGAAVGDEVVLFGHQGSVRIGAEDIAQAIGTIPYEITCAVSKRVPRMYL